MMVTTKPPPRPPSGDAPSVGSSRQTAAPLLPAMWAAFFREFWSLLPLAVFLLLAATMLMGVLAWDGTRRKPLWIDLRDTMILFETYVRIVLAMGCAVAGTIIGIFQARAEVSDSQWAFMKHRPAGATLLFGGRALAGMALYAIGAGIPVAGLLIYAAAHDRPFEWHFLLPMVADTLTGLIYYLAGLLVVQRQASVFGSRVLPLVGAMACSACASMVPRFYEALLILALAAILYGAAALGAQSSNGFRVRAPVFARGALAVVLFVSLSALLVIASWFGESLVITYAHSNWTSTVWKMPQWRTPEIDALKRNRQVWVRYVLLPDATLGKETYTPPLPGAETQPDYDYLKCYTYERLDPPGTEYPPTLVHHQLEDGTFADVLVVILPPMKSINPLPHDDTRYHTPQAYSMNMGAKHDETWWYVEPAGIFQVYDATGRFLGSLGQNGFAAPGATATSFGVDWGDFYSYNNNNSEFEIATTRGIFKVDLTRRTVTPYCICPVGVRVLGYVVTDPPIVVGPDRLCIFNNLDVTHPAREVPLASPVDVRDFSVGYIPDAHRWAVWYGQFDRIDLYDDAWQMVSHIDVPGPFFRVLIVPPPPEWYRQATADITRQVALRTGILRAVCNLPCVSLVKSWNPSLQSVYEYVKDAHANRNQWFYGFFYIDPEYASSPWYYGSVGATLLVSALAMWFLARRYDARFPVLWIIATLVFGPVMLLVLAALHVLPRRLACPACGKTRFIAAPRCQHCGAEFPASPAMGNEIYTQIPGGAA